MRIGHRLAVAAASLLGTLFLGTLVFSSAQAQTVNFPAGEIALKSGETAEVSDVYFINANCQSMLKGTPEVEILNGPSGVTAAITAAKVVPRDSGCVGPVSGGKLILTAKDIQKYSYTRMVFLVHYKTFGGDKRSSDDINLALYPPN